MTFPTIRLRRFLFSTLNFFLKNLLWLILISLGFSLVFIFSRADSVLQSLSLKPKQLVNFFRSPKNFLDHTEDRTNFLILGIRGEGDQAPDLTDTMLLVSYSHTDKTATLISIPRDLWVNSLKTKINAVYHYGRLKEQQGGRQLIQSAVLETLGLPIHYTLVIDFSIFKEAINLVDGVDLNVPRGFTDEKFPIPGQEAALPLESRYQTVSFNQGWQHMDGEMALKYVRSRNSTGEEGTDIARSERQHLVIQALKDKILSPSFLLNQQKTKELINLIKMADTNITSDLYPSLARVGLNIRTNPLKEVILDYETKNQQLPILENPATNLYQGQWVLIARGGNWEALRQFIDNKLKGTQ